MKNIGEPCGGKLHARFDEGDASATLSRGTALGKMVGFTEALNPKG
jgi:hypothetical protein